MTTDWEPVIGLEIHVHLKTRTKMFCACEVVYSDPPNSHTCPVCLAHPGALPVPNLLAIEHTVKLGLALGCEIAPRALFHRKNYFYPDNPKGYQISQYDVPLCNLKTAGIRYTSKRLEPIIEALYSTLSCRGSSPGVPHVTYSHARSGHALSDYLRSRAALAGVVFDPTGTLEPTAAICGDQEPSLRDYRGHGQTGHELTDEATLSAEGLGQYEIDRTILGRLLCFRGEDGRFRMGWTDNRSGVYAAAFGRARDLIPWWESSAGPLD